MARGYPDWGVLTSQIASHETDLAELAARLGSPYTFTRSGKVLFYDTFRGGIPHWILSNSGTGSTAIALLTTGFFAPGSLRLISGTAVSTAYAGIKKRFPDLTNGKYGIEILFWCTHTDDIMEVSLYRNSGASQYQFAARVNLNADKLQVYNDSALYTDIATIGNLALTDESWNVLKMVIDVNALTYKSVRLNGTLVTSGFPSPDTIGSITDPGLIELRLKKSNPVSSAKAAYVASCILTIDEP